MSVECPKCQQANEDDDEFCGFCGAALTIPVVATSSLNMMNEGALVSPKRCPSHPDANLRVQGEHMVCSVCGADLGLLDASEGQGSKSSSDFPIMVDPGRSEEVEKTAILEIEGGQEVFFRGAYTTRIPLKSGTILVGRRDVMAGHYPDVDLMMYRKLDPAISRRHLRILKENGRYYLEDLCNNNATFLNDYTNKLNHERRELHHGDRVFVSMSLALLFRLQE